MPCVSLVPVVGFEGCLSALAPTFLFDFVESDVAAPVLCQGYVVSVLTAGPAGGHDNSFVVTVALL